MTSPMDLGTYLDAQQRLLAAGYALTYRTALNSSRTYVVLATVIRTGVVRSSTRSVSITRATVRLADRLAPGAK